jgi:hypothetical protein
MLTLLLSDSGVGIHSCQKSRVFYRAFQVVGLDPGFLYAGQEHPRDFHSFPYGFCPVSIIDSRMVWIFISIFLLL